MAKQLISRGGINNQKLIYNSQSFLNPYTREYLARVNAGGSNVRDVLSINNFINGIVRLGL